MHINEVVPFLAVKDMVRSVSFYVDGLGFEITARWEPEGQLRWCRLQRGDAGLMLQQFKTDGHDARTFSENKGEGVSLMFMCDDVIDYYRELKERGHDASEPQVGNALWVTDVRDPDGYRLSFEAPTDVSEGTKLSEWEDDAYVG